MEKEKIVVLRALHMQGGTPACPRAWTEEGEVYRAYARDVYEWRPGRWPAVTHLHGGAACRLATPEEVARLEALEAAGERDSRPYSLWQGRPVPPAPRYARVKEKTQ
jgi:hypothetical protein